MPKTIEMLRDMAVSPRGYDNEKWLKGEVHENVPDALADDLTAPQTLAAIEVTGDAKTDAAAKKEAGAAAHALAQSQAEAAALADAAAQAAQNAVKGKLPNAPKA